MKCFRALVLTGLLFLLLAGLARLFSVSALDLFDTLGATVKISICGNNIIEGGEDCEGLDLNGQTCIGLGYVSGDLTCDIACSFDTSGCVAPTPTPTPTVTPTSTPTNTPTPTSTPTVTPTSTITPTATPTTQPVATNTPAPAATATPAPQSTNTPAPVPTPVPVIPAVVAVFDFDGDGKIKVEEVFPVVKAWVAEWNEAVKEKVTIRKCDVNRDRKCDLLDLSILLYYVGK